LIEKEIYKLEIIVLIQNIVGNLKKRKRRCINIFYIELILKFNKSRIRFNIKALIIIKYNELGGKKKQFSQNDLQKRFKKLIFHFKI